MGQETAKSQQTMIRLEAFQCQLCDKSSLYIITINVYYIEMGDLHYVLMRSPKEGSIWATKELIGGKY